MKMNLCLYAFVLLLNLIIIQHNTKRVLSVSSDNHVVTATSSNNSNSDSNSNGNSNGVSISSKKRCPDKEESIHSKKLTNVGVAGAGGVSKDIESGHFKVKLPHRFCNNATHCGYWKDRFWHPRGCFYQDISPSDARYDFATYLVPTLCYYLFIL